MSPSVFSWTHVQARLCSQLHALAGVLKHALLVHGVTQSVNKEAC